MPLLSSSENSDIVTLGEYKDDEHAGAEEVAASEEFYLGTPCSSQYTFGAAETGRSPNSSAFETEKQVSFLRRWDHFKRRLQSVGLNHRISSACFLNGQNQV